MKFIIDKSNILEAVNIANKGISSRTTIQILQSYLIVAKENKIKIFSSDTEISIETISECEVIESGQVALDAKLFSDIIRKLPNQKVEISVDEHYLTTIKSSSIIFRLQGTLGDEFIKFPTLQEDLSFVFSGSKLKEMINKTKFSVAIKEYKPILKGELLEIKDGSISLVSMDGYRISIMKNKIDYTGELKTVIPAKTLIELSKILKEEDDDEIIVNVNNKYVNFDLGNTKVITRVLEGKYPVFSSLFTEDYNTMININKSEFHDAIDRAGLMAKESKKNPIIINISDDVLLVKSNTELGETREEINIKKKGKDLKIAFNPRFLFEAISAIEDEEISILFTSDVNPCIIKSLEKDIYKYLILPIKISED